MQEFRTGATRQNMETTHMKEETKRLRSQLGELREKLADLDAKVTTTCSTKFITNDRWCWSIQRVTLIYANANYPQYGTVYPQVRVARAICVHLTNKYEPTSRQRYRLRSAISVCKSCSWLCPSFDI